MKQVEDAQIEQAKKDVESGRVQRVAVPGQWRVFKDEEGRLVVERYAEAVMKDTRGELGSSHDLDV